jgi:putative phosphoesterase
LKFGLTGDTHNNLVNIKKICSIFNENKVDFVVHTGDITLPKSLSIFSKLHMPLHGVYGNNDQGEIIELSKVCDRYMFNFSKNFKVIELGQRKIWIVHDPEEIEDFFFSDGNIIVHGHTHRFRDEICNNTYIFNPGECAGMMKNMNSVGIISVEQPSMEIIKF